MSRRSDRKRRHVEMGGRIPSIEIVDEVHPMSEAPRFAATFNGVDMTPGLRSITFTRPPGAR